MDIDNLTPQEIEELYSDIIEGPDQILIAKCTSYYFSMGGQYCCQTYSGGVQCNVSDERLKNIIGDSSAGLEQIVKLKVKDFTYKFDSKKIPHVGVIAQELQEIFPNSVKEDVSGIKVITQEEMFYAMINSIKELNERIKKLEAENK